ncbi:deoxyribonuclease IV [Candidatus Uhrbacteria bacterium]|nr:deoxyribonuclease IV [Candidatus Uhrbacteria bacterium]
MDNHHFMFLGAHISAAGSLANAPKNGASLGCEAIQFFSRPPQGGKPKPVSDEDAASFQTAMRDHGVKRAYIHAPYFINLASSENRIRHGSVAVLREELERGSQLGAAGMMFHPGSSKNVGRKEGERLVIDGLDRIMEGYGGSCQLLIEISAGAGMVMGDTFEALAMFLDGARRGSEIGICFDTQHAFASGYDITTKKGLDETLETFNALVGLDRLVASHCNDSKVGLGEHKDRHEHLGEGKMGLRAFELFVTCPKLQHLDLILETPMDEKREEDMRLLKSFRL